MPNYFYTARDERGNAVSGTLAAPSQEALADQLRRTGCLVTKSRELAQGAAVEALYRLTARVRSDDLVLLNVQLSKLVQVGIPLVTALDTLAEQTESAPLRQAVTEVARSVEAGSSFSEALAHHPAVFSELFTSMVRAGEASGRLDEILRRLATFAKHQAELRQQLTTALTYPLLLMIVGCGAIVFLVTGIIPKFMKVFLEARVPLPLPTVILYHVGQLLRAHWLPLAAAFIGGLLALRFYLRTRDGRRRFDALALKLPVLGDLVRKAAFSRLARTLETLLASGVPVLESLGIAEQTCGNAVIGDICRATQDSVRQGGSMAEPLRRSREVPPMVVQMIAVGETSGTVDHMLAEIADHYDELVGHTLKRLMALIEPCFLLIMGGMVALIMASVLLPMFRMVHVIR